LYLKLFRQWVTEDELGHLNDDFWVTLVSVVVLMVFLDAIGQVEVNVALVAYQRVW
jgi:hypothetical protein